jgi:hypothetical protein
MMGDEDQLAALGAAVLDALSREDIDAPVWALQGDSLLIEGWIPLGPEAVAAAFDLLDRRQR